MAYEQRFGCTSKRPKDYRHDPAQRGIFIHGGTIVPKCFKHNARPNDFGVTWPVSSQMTDDESRRLYELSARRLRTFQQAVDFAAKVRAEMQKLAGYDIFACTDLMMDSSCSGRYQVQRVA